MTDKKLEQIIAEKRYNQLLENQKSLCYVIGNLEAQADEVRDLLKNIEMRWVTENCLGCKHDELAGRCSAPGAKTLFPTNPYVYRHRVAGIVLQSGKILCPYNPRNLTTISASEDQVKK